MKKPNMLEHPLTIILLLAKRKGVLRSSHIVLFFVPIRGQNLLSCSATGAPDIFPVADILTGSWHRPTAAGRGPTGWRMSPPT